MRRIGGLDQHLALAFHATCTTGHLHQALRQFLAAPKVGTEQALVCIDHDHQRQIGKMVTLGQHLRADQNSGFPGGRHGQRFVHRPPESHTVAVDACNIVAGERLAKRLFQPLGAVTQRPEVTATLGTIGIDRTTRAAMVTAQFPAPCMHSHARIAANTLGDPATTGTNESGREASAIEKHECLTIGLQVAPDGCNRRITDALGRAMHIQIDQAQQRWRGGARARG